MTPQVLAIGFLQRLADLSAMHVAVWCALVTLSIALIVLARTRWRDQRPLEKCAVLSLIVHLLFACFAMMVHVVTGQGSGSGTSLPIRIRIVEESQPSTIAMSVPPVDERAPQLLSLPEPEPAAQLAELTAEAAQQERAESFVAESAAFSSQEETTKTTPTDVTELAPVANDFAVPRIAPDPNQVQDMSAVTDVPPLQAPAPLSDASVDQTIAGSAHTSDPTLTAASVSPAPVAETYALRTDADRLGLVESQGGSRQTEAAVAAALQWLVSAQSADGRWDASRFGAGRELQVLEQNRGGAGANADTGISALALLAFLGAGHTHQSGDYTGAVDRGIDFLLRSQAADGSLFGHAELYAQMYCHSMATFALAESLAVTRDKRLEAGVRRAISFSLRAQHPSAGGWRYRVGDIGDTSQLGWQVMALTSAERGGVGIPPHTWTGVERFLRSVRRGEHGGLASYRPDSPASTSMTAEAFYCRGLVAEVTHGRSDERAASEATAQLLASLPDRELVNLYYWYYATLALHHRHATSAQARAAWFTWNGALTSVLLESQVAEGTDAGSWEPNCLWGGYGGRVYMTSLAALCLEVYYRYAPPPGARDPWIATRPSIEDRAN